MKPQPTIEWQVNGACNYDCTYCIQSKKSRVGRPERAVIDAIVNEFATLPGVWEIKMSGGEPFAHKGFIEWAIPGLIERTPHLVSVLTNFSAPEPILERFAVLTGDQLRITSASLHLEFTELASFLDKARRYQAVRAIHNPHSSFVINSVLVPKRIQEQFAIKKHCEDEGFRYFPQIMKTGGGIYPYTDRDARLIEELTQGSVDPRRVNRAPSYKGKFCHAGHLYATVNQRGEVWSCRTAKRYGGFDDEPEREDGYLGNMVDGTFSLNARGAICDFDICPCTVPVNRGIVVLGAP